MSELISLFRKISTEPTPISREGQALGREDGEHPEYFVQLLDYLRKQGRQQGRALRIAIDALADAD